MTQDSLVTKIGGPTAVLYASKDWSQTPLGAYANWPQPLPYLINSMLSCPIPMYICWGPRRIFLYNDAYSVLLSKKHPAALGLPFEVVWPEVWPDLRDLFQGVAEGRNFYFEDMRMVLERHGFSEECFFTFSFNPIFDGSAQTIGLQCICYETTSKILSGRAILKLKEEADEARRRSEVATEELDNFFRNVPVALALVEGPTHVFKYSNRLYEKLIGRKVVPGATVRDTFPDLVDQPFFGLLDQVYSKGQSFAAKEAPIILENDGVKETAFLDFKYSPRVNAAGLVEGISVTVIDVTSQVNARKIIEANATELQAAQVRLDEERRKLEIIFENAASAMAMVAEPNHIFEKVNPAFLALFGDRVRIGRPVGEQFPDLMQTNFMNMLNAVYADGKAYKSYEEQVSFRPSPDKEVEIRYFDISFIQLKSGLGKIEGVLIDIVDVTDRVLSRRKLEESEEWLQLATKAAKIGIWDLDPKANTLRLADRAAEIFGFGASHVVPLSLALGVMHPDDIDLVHRSIEGAMDASGNGQYEVTHRVIDTDGSVRWVSVYGQARFDARSPNQSPRLTGSIIDITANVTAQNEVIFAREAAEEANSAKSAFLANMSHEIRSPLGAIMGFVELLKDSLLSREEMLEYLGVIERNSHQLLRIIDDILDLSKVEAGKMLVEHIDFSLLEVMADFASLMGFRARENGIDFILKAETSLPDPVSSDPTRIRQILSNIVGNAIKFTRKGVVELAVNYHAPMLRFKVSDSGVGISGEESQRLFQAFGQADRSTTRKFGGTGLGLVLTKKLSQALGGDFWLESSEVGKGSVFIAEIRIDLPSHSHMLQGSRFRFTTQPVKPSILDASLLKGIRILVVEDSPDNQMLLRVLLMRYGAKVEIAEDGQVGVEKALASGFDIILMDVQMPRLDGYDAVRQLRRKKYDKPIIALTAHAMTEEREKCLKVGYSDFLSKPIERCKLIDALKNHLNLT